MNPPDGQTPLDYLNQIAPQTPKRAGFGLNLKTVLLIGGILIVLVVILAVVVSSTSNGPQTNWQRLAARLNTTETISNTANTNIKNSQLRSLNSELKIYITNTERDLGTRLTALNIKTSDTPEQLALEEANTPMFERLEVGRLNAKYDSTYAREMAFQLGTILALYQLMFNEARTEADKAFISAAYENLKPTQEGIANFSASNE